MTKEVAVAVADHSMVAEKQCCCRMRTLLSLWTNYCYYDYKQHNSILLLAGGKLRFVGACAVKNSREKRANAAVRSIDPMN
jgi:hypothetical protein